MQADSNNDLAYADSLWKAADALRGQVDAAEYKHVALGLLFLKYISDAFETRREQLKAELEKDGIGGAALEGLLENRDEYTAERVFWVPPESRWANLQNQATRPDIATLIDDAILAVERDNPNLKSKLPRDYARRGIEPVKLKGLIDLVADIGFKGSRGKARDMLGRVYEYFLGKFAAAEGKLGGEFYTPRSIVRVLVEMHQSFKNIPGFCNLAIREKIVKHGHVLAPLRYVGAEDVDDNVEEFSVKYPVLAAVVRQRRGGL